MKTILYVVSTLKRSGPTNQLSYIIKYLDREKFIPVILTLSPEPIQNSMKDYFISQLDVRVETLGLSRIQGLFFAEQSLKKFMKSNKIDFVHSQGIRADSLMNGIDIPRVATLRNYPYLDYPMKFGVFKGNLMARKHLAVIKKDPNNNIACAKTIAREFTKHHLELTYIQNGVDTEKYLPLDKGKKERLRDCLGLDCKGHIFITVGSLIPRKDMITVIEGFKKADLENSLLLVAGDGIEKNMLKNDAPKNVMFLGNISNVVEYLQASDCFISASLAEGLPNTVLEAMACGLPAILSNIPSHLELYENEVGCFFDTQSSAQLATLLRESSENINLLGDLSLRLVVEKYSAEAMSNKYQKAYEERLNGSV